ncbi:GntR family transcriptional regulator [Methylobacterium sp.]|jgi:DNA-binding GntR family transcriptional regulator|uniref:GntR family transcriptional regulator n=1 Tax=Methylobacterium sp. TaxID=409 RepID=UPI00261FC966|nr:GntR family transcriptional regulator [Methylobacterium sp.]
MMLDSAVQPVIDDGTAGAQPVAPAAATSAASLHDTLLAQLRDYIVEGNLAPGARVPERTLCERFGISRTPLREALKVLASEGLIDLLPNRGARVRQLEAHEMVALFDVMGGLEALAGRLACEKITEAGYAEIERLHHAMYASYLRRDLHGYFAGNQAIHDRIVQAAGNEPLAATYANFAGRLRRVRYAANLDKDRDRWGEAMREHEEILDALRRRAGAELSDILFRHLRNKRRAAAVQEGAAPVDASRA